MSTALPVRVFLLLAILSPGAPFADAQDAPAETPRRLLAVPGDVAEAAALEARSKAQFAALEGVDAFYFFGFEDRLPESGIRFRHQIVDDAGRDYKMVHYDHGNGVAAADVDGDGKVDLYFTSQLGGNELWRNAGGGRFEDWTERAGVGLDDRVSVAASFADADGDGDPDLFVTTVRMGNVLFENLGEGRFRDVTAAAGVGYVGHSSGSVFFDYDRDGDLDLFVTNVGTYTTDRRGRGGYYVGVEGAFSGHRFPERTEKSLLYENLGGLRFREVAAERGLADTGWAGDAAAADVDGDGWVDVYVLNMQGDDHFYLNREGRFVEATAEWFPKTPWGSMGIAWLDFDNDGHLDLFLTDMHSDMSETIGPEREKLKSRMQWGEDQLQGGENNVFGNAFYRGAAEPPLAEVSDEVGAENYWPWGVSAGDLNADGYEDLFVTSSMNYPFRYGVNSLLLNDLGRRFVDAEFVLGVEPRRDQAVTTPWFDLECGGADAEHPDCAGHDVPVTVLGALGSRSSVMVDLEGDGDLDVVTNELNSPPMVLVSDLAAQRKVNHLVVDLVGSASNRDGLGAVVTVVAGELVQTRHHDGKSGYLAQSSLPLYFGLGDHAKVDRVTVRWPSGVLQTVTDGIVVGQPLVVREPAPETAPADAAG